MQIGLFQTARMEQRLVQSPQMIQAMQILQLTTLGLQERIERELLENPLLEWEEGPAVKEARDDSSVAGRGGELGKDGWDRWEQTRRHPRGPVDGPDRKHQAMLNTPVAYHSLGESLLSLIALMELDDRQREMVEYLVFSLDARGYLPGPLSLVAEECRIEGATEDGFALLLEELRHATHPALGALDLRECLLLQVDAMFGDHLLLRTLIEEHLADIAINRILHVAHCTGHSIADVSQAIELLRTLDPCPGSQYGEAPAEVINPEIVAEERDGVFRIHMPRERTRKLRTTRSYEKLLREAPRDDGDRKWIQQRLESARWFIDTLQHRENTLLRVARAIFERQQDFLDKGVKALRPLRMAEIAEVTGVHISTVSRAVAGKYVQTPHGILALRSFFSGGTETSSGGVASQKSIQERVKELVASENPSAPHSDGRLAELLLERDGIRLARRTITKYRKVMNIASSQQRRIF